MNDLRDRIRRAICEAHGFDWDPDWLEPDEYGEQADAVLAVLPATVDRAAVLREAADRYEEFLAKASPETDPRYWTAVRDITLGLRHMADETQQPEEAWPSDSQWRVEIYDPGAGQWMPAGTLTTKPEAERRLALAVERSPKWRDDGTDVRRRIVRTTVTYTVEAEVPWRDVEFVGGGQCAKPAGHRPPGS